MAVAKRQQKTSLEQKEIYCSFLEANPQMTKLKPKDKCIQILWEQLTELLNATKGCSHSIEEWKKIFDNWRYVTCHKARQKKSDLDKTGGGASSTPELSALEEKAMSLWGRVIIEGNPQLGVAGFDLEVQFLDEMDLSAQTSTTNKEKQEEKGKKRAKLSSQSNIDDEFLNEWRENKKSQDVSLKNIQNSLQEISQAVTRIADVLEKYMTENIQYLHE